MLVPDLEEIMEEIRAERKETIAEFVEKLTMEES